MESFYFIMEKHFNYTGVASRKEFWLGSIMNTIAMYVGLIPAAPILMFLSSSSTRTAFTVVWILLFFIPLFSLYVRRANDVGLKALDTLLVAVAPMVYLGLGLSKISMVIGAMITLKNQG